MEEDCGWLCLVPTPIGNLDDMTFRALKKLHSCDRVLAEDTRTTGQLLKHYEVIKPLSAFHQHNEHKVKARWADGVAEGQKIALVSDAGTPGLSDPGHSLITACVERHLPVEVLPGPTAFLPALLLSGLPNHRFAYEGFLPPKKGRQKKLTQLAEEERTLILYESPHRTEKLLVELAHYFGPERRASISREISKRFEETLRGTVGELLEAWRAHPRKGEIVITLEGKSTKT